MHKVEVPSDREKQPACMHACMHTHCIVHQPSAGPFRHNPLPYMPCSAARSAASSCCNQQHSANQQPESHCWPPSPTCGRFFSPPLSTNLPLPAVFPSPLKRASWACCSADWATTCLQLEHRTSAVTAGVVTAAEAAANQLHGAVTGQVIKLISLHVRPHGTTIFLCLAQWLPAHTNPFQPPAHLWIYLIPSSRKPVIIQIASASHSPPTCREEGSAVNKKRQAANAFCCRYGVRQGSPHLPGQRTTLYMLSQQIIEGSAVPSQLSPHTPHKSTYLSQVNG